MSKSMIEEAKAILENNGSEMKFADLWGKVKEALAITPEDEPEKIGNFYTDLSLSGDFVVLGDNVWDLTSRQVYDRRHIDVADVYNDVNTSDNDEADVEEEKEYNQSVNGAVLDEEENDDDEDEKKDSSFDFDYKKDDISNIY